MTDRSDNNQLATVHPLPVEQQDVVEGELLTDEEYRELTSQRAQAMARWRGYRSDAVVVARTARTVATHQRTKAVVRELTYIPVGVAAVARRRRDARGNSRYERMMRAAEAAGDFEAVAEWEARAVAERQRRHARRMEWIEAPVKVAKGLGVAAVTAAGGLFGLGVVLAVADQDISMVGKPLMVAAEVVKGVSIAISVAWGPLVLAAPWLGVLWLWREGRRAGAQLPRWIAPVSTDVSEGEPVTPARVVLAFRDLGISTLKTAIQNMGDGAAMILGPIKIAGCGVEVDVTLPHGSTTTLDVQKRRRRLAENLDRHEHELHITLPTAPRTVRLWIADSGALDEPIGPSPLVTDPDMVADVFSGRAPWGQDLRGDTVGILLWQMHLLITGISNQGKTAALRALVLWLALDRSVELRIADLKGVGDWRMFDGIATTLIQGPTDQHVIAATEMLEMGVMEMERRLDALEKSGATDGITKEMSRKPGSGFHPLVLVVDEAQQAFMSPAIDLSENSPFRGDPCGGTKATSRYFNAARKIHNQGRAVNVTLWQGTQDPTDQNLPKIIREGAHIRASLVLGTESQAKMALGETPVEQGAAPHKLRQGLDKGTLVAVGAGVPIPQGQPSLTVRTHFVSGKDAAAIAERIKRMRAPVDTADGSQQRSRDHLTDIINATRGEARVGTDVIRKRLTDIDRAYYEGWTARDLTAALAEHDVTPRKSHGVMVVRYDDLIDALDASEDTE